MSKISSGEVRHFTCGRWANVEIPEKPHCNVSCQNLVYFMEFQAKRKPCGMGGATRRFSCDVMKNSRGRNFKTYIHV
jgi:hypothetical protein